MQRLRHLHRPDLTAGILRGLLVGTSAVALLISCPAFAQDVGDTTGAQGDAATTAIGSAATVDGIRSTTTTYVPVSTGAVADAEDTPAADSIFADDGDSSGLRLGAEPAIPSRAPSTARARAATRSQVQTGEKAQPTQEQRVRSAEDAASAEEEFMTGTVREQPVAAAEDLAIDGGAPVGEPIEGLPPLVEDDPFAAPGIRVGTFILRPSVELGVTASSNVNQSVGGESGVLSDTTLRLNAVSDWSRHSAALDAYGNFRNSISGEDFDETEAGVDARLDLDLANDWRATGGLGYLRQPETASSPVVIPETISDPLLQTYSGSAGLEKHVGKVRLGILGLVAHEDYSDAELVDGTSLSQEDRNNTLGTVTLRGGYEISPAVTPFAEVEIGQRKYDEEVDASGYRRSSDRLGFRGGLALDLGEKLVGEMTAGWIREEFDDDRLVPIEGGTFGANLNWSPERDTTVNLYAATTVEGTTTPGESGSLLHAGRISATRLIRANLTGTAAIGAGYRDYTGSEGRDTLFDAELSATWWINRYAGLTGRLRYESLDSNLPDRDYDASSAFLGLTVRR